MSSELNLIYPYYKNPQMLTYQCNYWRSLPRDLKDRLCIVIVDDGTPDDECVNTIMRFQAEIPQVEVYKVLKNIPWNQNGARNLAMKAVSGWCLITDMDHVVPEWTLQKVLDMPKDERGVYTFARRPNYNLQAEDYKRHPNSWLMTAERYWLAGGMDEDFCGWYGSDSTFRKALQMDSTITELDDYLIVFDENAIPDANTRDLGRKHTKYYSPNNPKLQEKRKSPGYKAKDPIRFPWRRVL